MLELLSAANEAAVVLQRRHRARTSAARRPTRNEPHTPPTPAPGRSRSPTAVSAALVGSPTEAYTPSAVKNHHEDLQQPAFYAVAAQQALWPAGIAHTPAPAPASQSPRGSSALGAPGCPAPPLPPGPPPSLHGFSGLTIQAPSNGNVSSPPYSPAPHSAPPASGMGVPSGPVGSPHPPPPSASAASSPAVDTPALQRPRSLDDALLSAQTPWQQSRVQSRLSALGSPSEAAQLAAGP